MERICVLPVTAHIEETNRNHVARGEDRVIKGRSWNTWIVTCSVIIIIMALLFLENHIRGLHSSLAR